jgi:hypothetical protein
MASKERDLTMTGPNFASAEYAEQWRHDKKRRSYQPQGTTGGCVLLPKSRGK